MKEVNPFLAWFYQGSNLKQLELNPKAKKILDLVNKNQINLSKLRKLSQSGNPDEPAGVRSLVWKVLLGYLSVCPKEWKTSLKQHRSNYQLYLNELITPNDELWTHIEKDIRRTRRDMHFFWKPKDTTLTYQDVTQGNVPPRVLSKPFMTGLDEVLGHSDDPYLVAIMNNPDIEKHADVVARILFIYAKLNKDVSYVQGMNELLAPIYYLFSMDTHPDFKDHVEADAFFCFCRVMSALRDFYVVSLDYSENGICTQLQTHFELIKLHDYKLFLKMKALKIKPFYYSAKWLLLLFSQELSIPEVFRLWDLFFAHSKICRILHYFCLAVVIRNKPRILKSSLNEALLALQHPNLDNLQDLIHRALCLSK